MAHVAMTQEGPVAGVWAETDDGDGIGLVAQEGVGVYLTFYPQQLRGGKLPFAIALTHSDHGMKVQVPGPDGKPTGTTMYSLEEIVKHIGQLAPAPA